MAGVKLHRPNVAVVGIKRGGDAGVPKPMRTRLEADGGTQLGDDVIQPAAGKAVR